MKYLALFLIFLFQTVQGEESAPWRIAIIGDTHDSPQRMEGSEGVAVNFIKTLYGEILKHQVDMVIQVGDMADIEGSAPVNGLAKRKELNKMLEEKASPSTPCAATMNPSPSVRNNSGNSSCPPGNREPGAWQPEN